MNSQASSWQVPLLVVVTVAALIIVAYQGLMNRDRRQNLKEPKLDISRLSGIKLQWQMGAICELLAGNDLAASLVFDGSSIRSAFVHRPNPATGKSLDCCWIFTPASFDNFISVETCNEKVKVADFEFTGGRVDGTLTLADKRRFTFVNTAFRGNELRMESGQTLVTFTLDDILLGKSFAVEINPDFASVPELPWMIILGCYILAIKVTAPFIP